MFNKVALIIEVRVNVFNIEVNELLSLVENIRNFLKTILILEAENIIKIVDRIEALMLFRICKNLDE